MVCSCVNCECRNIVNETKWKICVFSSFCVHEKSASAKLAAFIVGHKFLMAAHKERTILATNGKEK